MTSRADFMVTVRQQRIHFLAYPSLDNKENYVFQNCFDLPRTQYGEFYQLRHPKSVKPDSSMNVSLAYFTTE